MSELSLEKNIVYFFQDKLKKIIETTQSSNENTFSKLSIRPAALSNVCKACNPTFYSSTSLPLKNETAALSNFTTSTPNVKSNSYVSFSDVSNEVSPLNKEKFHSNINKSDNLTETLLKTNGKEDYNNYNEIGNFYKKESINIYDGQKRNVEDIFSKPNTFNHHHNTKNIKTKRVETKYKSEINFTLGDFLNVKPKSSKNKNKNQSKKQNTVVLKEDDLDISISQNFQQETQQFLHQSPLDPQKPSLVLEIVNTNGQFPLSQCVHFPSQDTQINQTSDQYKTPTKNEADTNKQLQLSMAFKQSLQNEKPIENNNSIQLHNNSHHPCTCRDFLLTNIKDHSSIHHLASLYVFQSSRCGASVSKTILLMVQIIIATDWNPIEFSCTNSTNNGKHESSHNVKNDDEGCVDDVKKKVQRDVNLEGWSFSCFEEVVLFSVCVLEQLAGWLDILDRSCMSLLVTNHRIIAFSPTLVSHLHSLISAQTDNSDHETSSMTTSRGTEVSFDEENDSRSNFPNDLSFHAFKKQRDLFCNALNAWKHKHHDTALLISTKAAVNEVLECCAISNTTLQHFVNFFIAHLLNSGNEDDENVDQCLKEKVGTDKLKKLQGRLTSSSSSQPSSSSEDFFTHFITISNNQAFSISLSTALVFHIYQSSESFVELIKEGVENKMNNTQQFAEEFRRRLLTLKKLGSTLGFINFMPYRHHDTARIMHANAYKPTINTSINSSYNAYNSANNTAYNGSFNAHKNHKLIQARNLTQDVINIVDEISAVTHSIISHPTSQQPFDNYISQQLLEKHTVQPIDNHTIQLPSENHIPPQQIENPTSQKPNSNHTSLQHLSNNEFKQHINNHKPQQHINNHKPLQHINNHTKQQHMHRLPVLLAWSLEFLSCVDVDGVMVTRYVKAVAVLRSLHRYLLQKPRTCTILKLCVLMLEEFFNLQIFPEDSTSQQSQPLHSQIKHELDPLHVCSMHPVVIQRCFPHYLDSIRRALEQASFLKAFKTGLEGAEGENNGYKDVMEIRLDGSIKNNNNEVVNDDSGVKVVRCRKIVPVIKVDVPIPVITTMKGRKARQGADIQARLEAGFLQIHSSSLEKSVEFVCERIFSSWNLTCQSDVLAAEAQESRKAVLKILKKLTAEKFKQKEVVSALVEHLASNHNLHKILPSIQSHLVRIATCLSCLLPTTTVSQVLVTTIQLCQRAFLLKAKHWIKQNFSFDALLRKMVSETNKMMSQSENLKGCCILKSFHLPSTSHFIQPNNHSYTNINDCQLQKPNPSSPNPQISSHTNVSKHDDPPKDNITTKSSSCLYNNHFPSLTASQPLNPLFIPSLHTAKTTNSKTTIVTNTLSHTPSIQPHTPSSNQPHTPSTIQLHTPSSNQLSTNQPKLPETNQPHTPSINQPHQQISAFKTSTLYAGFDQMSLQELSAFIFDDVLDSRLEISHHQHDGRGKVHGDKDDISNKFISDKRSEKFNAEVSSPVGDINKVVVNHIDGRGSNKVTDCPGLKAFEVLSLLQDKVLLNHFNPNGMSSLIHAELIAQAELYIQMDSELVLPVVKSQLTSLVQQLTTMG